MTDETDIAEAGDDYMADFSDDASTFGDRLVAAREAVGMSQGELARRLGVKAPTLQGWEEDRAEPRANKLQMLAGMLNVSMIWLMSGQGEGPEARDDAGGDAGAVEGVLTELRAIRAEYQELHARLGRLEKRLRSLAR